MNRLPGQLRPTGVDLAWVAGFFEGEGTVAIRRPRGLHACELYVAVVTTEPDLLAPFLAFGGSIRKHSSPNDRWKPSMRWTAYGFKALAFLYAVEPLVVSPRNLARIDVARRFQEGKRRKGRGGNVALSEQERGDEEWLRLEMKELNSRGR